MRWFWEPKSEHRAADFGAALSQAYQDLAGAAQVDAAKTAAAEFAIGLMGRAFALAEVDGVNIPAPTLEAIGRNLGLRGNAVFDVLADPVGGLVMMPAASWDIHGGPDPATWTYHLSLGGPSSSSDVTRMGSDVVHCRINALPESPWAGRSPLTAAGLSSALATRIELRASEEANAKAGTLLSTPSLNEASRTALKTDLGNLKGGVAMVENAGGNSARPPAGGPQGDWRTTRFGLNIPEANIRLRRDAAADVVAAFGVPSSLYSGQEGASVREGWRQFGVSCQAWGAIVGAELTEKLERPVALSFRKLASIDLSARSRFVSSMVQSGLSLADALELAELD